MEGQSGWVQVPERAGPYWFLAALGRGGMADVFLVAAESPLGLGKIQVLKRPRGDLDDPEFLAMFLDEGRLAARLEHPNIVRTTDVALFEGAPYIAMEYVEGQSLHRLVHDGRKGLLELDRATSLFIVSEVLQGLAYAHTMRDYDGSRLEIVHRDLSPGNILLSYSGEVKICDFGIAKAALRSSQTQTGIIKGKASYMAPEQLRGERVDHRVDIYGVGVLLWELLAGRSLFKQPLDALRSRRPPSLSTVTEIEPELEALCAMALAEDPHDRFQTAEEMLDVLEDLVSRAPERRARRQLAELMTNGFGEEREQLALLTRKQIQAVKNGHQRHSLPRVSGTASSLPPEPTSVSVLPKGPDAAPEPSPRGKRVAVTAAIAALVVGLALVALVLRGAEEASPAAATTGATPGPSPAALPDPTTGTERPEPLPEAPDVEVRILAVPPHAQIRLDGEVVDGNPATVERPRDGEEHQIVVGAPGYRSVEHVVRFDRDVALQIKLEAQPSIGQAPPQSAAPLDTGLGGTGEGQPHEHAKEGTLEDQAKPGERTPVDDQPGPASSEEPRPLDLDAADPWTR